MTSYAMPVSLRITVAGQWRLLTAFPAGRSRLANSKLVLQITSQFSNHLRFQILKSEISDSLRMSVTLGDPLAGFSSTTRSVSNTLRSSDSVITS